MQRIFDEQTAYKLRAYIVRNTPEVKQMPDPGISMAVVNASDSCALTCPNCLFSAALVKKMFKGAPPSLNSGQIKKFVELMNEGGLELLVFSGGGESYENLDAMCYAVEYLRHIREVVTITSGYFAKDQETTKYVLDRLTNAMRRGNALRSRSELDFTLRISFDTFHNVPIEQIVHLIEYAENRSGDGVRIRPIIRTLLDPQQNLDVKLADILGRKLFPEKDQNDPVMNLPIIDGFPTRWLIGNGSEIPVIYKPTYFLGFAKKQTHCYIPGTSWRDVKTAEEAHDGFFNLSLRGIQGEGHNFYETVLRGHAFWLTELGGRKNVITPKNQKAKRLAIYVPADGRMIINASSPDSWRQVETVVSWKDYWKEVSSDVLQQVVVLEPTDVLLTYAREVEPEIDSVLDARNFVFQIPYSVMETSALRLYLSIRILKKHVLQGMQLSDPIVSAIVNTPLDDLKKAYEAARKVKKLDNGEQVHKLNVIDSIVGNQESIWTMGNVSLEKDFFDFIKNLKSFTH